MLELKNLQSQYKDSSTFNFNLKLNPGDSLAIIGPSNSGKSTLLNLVAGFIPKTQGEMIFNGEDISCLNAKERPVNIIFQDNNNFEHLNIFNNVAIGISPNIKLTAMQKELVEFTLKQVGLDGFNIRFPYQLSDGQKQKVAIARAMLRNKPILLIDEAFDLLDPPIRIELLDLVKKLQEDKSLITLMTTLNYKDALRICNKACFIHDGKIIYTNSTKQFADATNNPIIKAYT